MLKTIMVVDDEEDIRESVKTLLEANSYKVILAKNGDDCLKKIAKGKPDLILMDIMMPGTPVREVVEKITGTKIAYFSVVKTTEAEMEKLMKKNVVSFIQKPFDINELLAKVKELTGN